MVERAIDRGEVSADIDAEVLLDLLFGPAYHRLLQSHLSLTDRFAKTVVRILVAGAGVKDTSAEAVGTSGGASGGGENGGCPSSLDDDVVSSSFDEPKVARL
jgi:hypothetical protein